MHVRGRERQREGRKRGCKKMERAGGGMERWREEREEKKVAEEDGERKNSSNTEEFFLQFVHTQEREKGESMCDGGRRRRAMTKKREARLRRKGRCDGRKNFLSSREREILSLIHYYNLNQYVYSLSYLSLIHYYRPFLI